MCIYVDMSVMLKVEQHPSEQYSAGTFEGVRVCGSERDNA